MCSYGLESLRFSETIFETSSTHRNYNRMREFGYHVIQ